MAEPTLYERLGGIFAIAAVVDNFSDRLIMNPKIVEANPELHEWHTETYHQRLPGLKWLRTLWLVEAHLVQHAAGRGPIVRLSGAHLSDVNLFLADLSGADLSQALLD